MALEGACGGLVSLCGRSPLVRWCGGRLSVQPRRSRYEEIADDVRAKIVDGTFPVGALLPSTAQLMEAYEVSNTVVQRAIRLLKHDGVVEGHSGKGVVVLRKPDGDESLASTPEQLKAMGERLDAFDARLAEVERRLRDSST